MDKQKESEMYDHSYRQLLFGDDLSHQRKVLLTRNLKLSSSENDNIYQVRGKELQNEEQIQKSILPFKKATIINPQNESAQLDLVKALFELEEENEAFSCMKKTLSLNPESSCFHELLIQMFQKKHRLEDFESFSNEVVDMIADPQSISFFHFANAQAWVKSDNYDQALLACQKAMKEDPPMEDYWLGFYGAILLHEGLYEEALIQFGKVKKGTYQNGAFWSSAPKYREQVRDGAAYVTYCLGGVQAAKEELEKIIAGGSLLQAGRAGWSYLLILCHLDEDEKVINHHKEHEFKGFFFLSDGDEWVRFYEQDLKITQKILERGDLDENTRKFNAKKLEALNVMLPFLRERVDEEIFRSKYCW